MDNVKKKHESGLRSPVAASDTIRRKLLVELQEGPVSALELSGRIGVPEKDIYEHLEHIRAMLHHTGRRLAIQPAECVKCGFLFQKRERLKKPGRCPVCRSESIHDPHYSLTQEK